MNEGTASRGLLAVIGGNEDRDGERAVLRSVVQALPVWQPRVMVFTGASGDPAALWAQYRPAFETFGARPVWLDARTPDVLERPEALAQLREIDLLFLTGGDQHRLMDVLDGSAAWRLIAQRHAREGLAIVGTSAGASALGARMPRGDEGDQFAGGPREPLPPGLGLWPRVIVDQHFAQRKRLTRLIHLLGTTPGHVGVGVDEDTALLLHPDQRIEVVGSGAVTVVAGAGQGAAQQPAGPGMSWTLEGLSLHLLTKGSRLDARQLPVDVPAALRHLFQDLWPGGGAEV